MCSKIPLLLRMNKNNHSDAKINFKYELKYLRKLGNISTKMYK